MQRAHRLVLREASDPAAYERGILAEYFDPVARDFIKVVRQALPDKPEGFHERAYLFGVGALAGTALLQRIAGCAGAGPK